MRTEVALIWIAAFLAWATWRIFFDKSWAYDDEPLWVRVAYWGLLVVGFGAGAISLALGRPVATACHSAPHSLCPIRPWVERTMHNGSQDALALTWNSRC